MEGFVRDRLVEGVEQAALELDDIAARIRASIHDFDRVGDAGVKWYVAVVPSTIADVSTRVAQLRLDRIAAVAAVAAVADVDRARGAANAR